MFGTTDETLALVFDTSEMTLENSSDVWDTLYGKKIKTTTQIETLISSKRHVGYIVR